jgi:hypothetical protein
MTWALQAAAECDNVTATEVWSTVVVIAVFCAFGAFLLWVLR